MYRQLGYPHKNVDPWLSDPELPLVWLLLLLIEKLYRQTGYPSLI
jgi:hypothetical protein